MSQALLQAKIRREGGYNWICMLRLDLNLWMMLKNLIKMTMIQILLLNLWLNKKTKLRLKNWKLLLCKEVMTIPRKVIPKKVVPSKKLSRKKFQKKKVPRKVKTRKKVPTKMVPLKMVLRKKMPSKKMSSKVKPRKKVTRKVALKKAVQKSLKVVHQAMTVPLCLSIWKIIIINNMLVSCQLETQNKMFQWCLIQDLQWFMFWLIIVVEECALKSKNIHQAQAQVSKRTVMALMSHYPIAMEKVVSLVLLLKIKFASAKRASNAYLELSCSQSMKQVM